MIPVGHNLVSLDRFLFESSSQLKQTFNTNSSPSRPCSCSPLSPLIVSKCSRVPGVYDFTRTRYSRCVGEQTALVETENSINETWRTNYRDWRTIYKGVSFTKRKIYSLLFLISLSLSLVLALLFENWPKCYSDTSIIRVSQTYSVRLKTELEKKDKLECKGEVRTPTFTFIRTVPSASLRTQHY